MLHIIFLSWFQTPSGDSFFSFLEEFIDKLYLPVQHILP